MKRILPFIGVLLCLTACQPKETGARWSEGKANAWYDEKDWPVGCDYIPAYAGNQIQMWQSETWDAQAIDRELGWAEALGLNSVRIFLHHKVWETEPETFFRHVEEFLSIAEKHGTLQSQTLRPFSDDLLHCLKQRHHQFPLLRLRRRNAGLYPSGRNLPPPGFLYRIPCTSQGMHL